MCIGQSSHHLQLCHRNPAVNDWQKGSKTSKGCPYSGAYIWTGHRIIPNKIVEQWFRHHGKVNIINMEIVQMCCGVTQMVEWSTSLACAWVEYNFPRIISAFLLEQVFQIVTYLNMRYCLFTLYLFSCKTSHLKLFVMTLCVLLLIKSETCLFVLLQKHIMRGKHQTWYLP